MALAKHECTDIRIKKIKRTGTKDTGKILAFRARDGAQLALYDLDDVEDLGDHLKFVFHRQNTDKRRAGTLRKATMERGKVKLQDFWNAPSFVVDLDKSSGATLRVDFICARIGTIVRKKMSKYLNSQ